MSSVPFLFSQLRRCCPQTRWRQELCYRVYILLLTYFAYISYHLSRKPISIVKNAKAFLDCGEAPTNSSETTICHSWITEIDGKNEKEAKTYLGLLDTSYLFSYSFFMFISGFVAERVDLRYFLSLGMLFSGLLTVLFGMAYTLNIHSLWYLLFIQIACGMFQSSGWPGVVTVMGNWFGQGKRGLIMGVWNSHTSVGNIIGSLVAGAFVVENWGMSFTVPGLIIGLVGFMMFLLLVPNPETVNLTPVTATHPDVENRTLRQQEEEPLIEGEGEEQIAPPPGARVSVDRTREEGASENAIGFVGALRIPGVAEFSMCLFFAKLVSYTFLYWLPNYISNKSHLNAEEAAFLSTIFDWGGIVGGIIAGVITDKTGMSASTCSGMLVFAIPLMFLYETMVSDLCPISVVDGGEPVYNACFTWNIVLLFLTGVLVNGPYALITTAVSAELGQHPSLQGSSKALATVTAIIDGTGSVGAAVGPFLAGPLSGNDHWDRVFYMLMGADIFALVLLSRLTKNEIIRYRQTRARRTASNPATASPYNSINS